jgi:uncharacterized protein (TIGR00255 family)
MRSMTGFGQARDESPRYAVAVSVKAVNGRFLDLVLRLRDEYRASEAPLRQRLAGELLRGRVEVNVDVRPLGPRRAAVEVHAEVVRALHEAFGGLVTAGLVAGDLTVGDLVRIPETFEVRPLEEAWGAADQELLLAVAERALAEAVAARGLEGEKLAAALAERIDGLAAMTARMGTLRAAVQEEAAASLRRRLGELLGERGIDEARLAQEAALLTERSDVGEELDRLAAHLEHFRTVMADDGAIGKRLDFLSQELLRELNTLGAKCRNPEMTRLVLDAKVLAEQLREQVQNVE